jgi:hypothetical protein
MLAFLMQTLGDIEVDHQVPGFMQRFLEFIDTPAPYSPFTEYLLVLFILWFIARKTETKKDFSAEAQMVLDEKFKRGELDKATYEKYRQELSMRIKKD